MDKKDTLKYHLSFSHYISCSHITFARPAFTTFEKLHRSRVNISPNTLKFFLFAVFKISIFSLEKFMR